MSVFTRRSLLSATFALGAVVAAALPAVAQQKSIKVGVMSGAEEEVAQVVKKVAAGKGLNVELVPFSDYALVNEALERMARAQAQKR